MACASLSVCLSVCAHNINLQNYLPTCCTLFKHPSPCKTSDPHSIALPLVLSNVTSNSGSRYGPVVGSCEHDNEFSSSTKTGNFFSSSEPTSSSGKTLIHGVCNLCSYLCKILTYLLDLLLTDLFSALLS